MSADPVNVCGQRTSPFDPASNRRVVPGLAGGPGTLIATGRRQMRMPSDTSGVAFEAYLEHDRQVAKFLCSCGKQVSTSGSIPNPNEWHLIADRDRRGNSGWPNRRVHRRSA
jgi:hypothetical protein